MNPMEKPTMSDDLKLTLPERGRPTGGAPKAVLAMLAILLAVGAANALILLSRGGGRPAPRTGLTPEAERDLAMKLEKQELRVAAVEAWKEYLALARPNPEEEAKIWYRIGTLYQAAGDFENALNGFYRSEGLAKVEELAPEIGRRTQECLEGLGKFAALRYELADRVGMGDSKARAGEEVVAEIGPQKITKADLDREIEAQIERQLAQYSAYLPEEEIQKQKEALLKRFSSSPERLRMLNQFVVEEILYRKAREAKLADDPATRSILRDVERKILAGRVMEKEFADQIKITPGDLSTYYEAHKKEFVQPARAQISHILVKDEKAAADLLKEIKGGKDFAEMAKAVSLDEATKAKGGEIEGWVERGSFVPGIGDNAEAMNLIFRTEAGKVAEKPIKSDKGVHVLKVRAREPERQKSFEEVQSEVHRALLTRKQREIQERLFEDLKTRYNVVIHMSQFPQEQPAPPTPAKPDQTKQDGKTSKP